MITKEKFLEAIEILKQQQETDDNFENHMEAAFPGSYAPIYDNHLWGLSIKLLVQLMEDPYEYIDWWIYETDYGKREEYKKTPPDSSDDALYPKPWRFNHCTRYSG